MLRAIVFDFDGVIADSELLHLAGFRHALAAHGIGVEEVDYFARYVGYDDRDGFRAILTDNRREAPPELVDELSKSKAQAFQRLAAERVRIFPGVERLLAELQGRGESADAVGVAIASGALSSEIAMILRVAGLSRYFEAVVAADDVARSKPHPEVYTKACEALAQRYTDLVPQQCIAIEDTGAGLRSAKAAGMATIAVTNTYSAVDLDADLVVSSLEEVDVERCRRLVDTVAAGGLEDSEL